MIHRDYFMRMIQDFIKMMMCLIAAKKVGNWKDVEAELEKAAQILFGLNRDQLTAKDHAELKELLIQSGPTHEFRVRAQVLARLLAESAEIASAQGNTAAAVDCNLKALHLLLDILLRCEEIERMDFTPTVESVVAALEGVDLPSETSLGLMNHYERQGEYAKAEDQLFVLVRSGALGGGLHHLGDGFYQRLMEQPDWALMEGGLPRDEVESGWEEFREQVKRSA